MGAQASLCSEAEMLRCCRPPETTGAGWKPGSIREGGASYTTGMHPGAERECTAVRVALGGSCAAAVGCFSNGTVGVWLSTPTESCTDFYSSCPREFEGDRICSLGIDSEGLVGLDEDSLGEISFVLGTESGWALSWKLDEQTGRLRHGRPWLAHTPAPSPSAERSGVVAVALEGPVVATGGADGDAAVWCQGFAEEWSSRADGPIEQQRRRGAHGGSVSAVAVDAASELTASAGEDGVVRLWGRSEEVLRAAHRDQRRSPWDPEGAAGGAVVNQLVLDAKHHRLGTAGEDGVVRMWDLLARRPTRRFAHRQDRAERSEARRRGGARGPRGAQAVAFDVSEAPTQLASGGADGSWQLWDVRQSNPEPVARQPRAHDAAVTSVALLGERLLSASADGQAALWDLRLCPSRPGSPRFRLPCLWEVNMLGLRKPAGPPSAFAPGGGHRAMAVGLLPLCHGCLPGAGDCAEHAVEPCPGKSEDLVMLSGRRAWY